MSVMEITTKDKIKKGAKVTATRQVSLGSTTNTGFTISCTSSAGNCTNGTISPGITCLGPW